jgi:hypothetical protein
MNDTKRAGGNAIATSVTVVFANVNRVELGHYNRVGRTDFSTGRVRAMLADIRHHQPRGLRSVLCNLLDELHVPPVHIRKGTGIVVAVSRQSDEAILLSRELIPLMAGDLAGLTSDAHGRIREEAYALRHVMPPPSSSSYWWGRFFHAANKDFRFVDADVRFSDEC